MLGISDEDPKMIRFDEALRKPKDRKRYAANTQRLYKWQAKKFLVAMQEREVKPQDLRRAAELYLRRLRAKHSRTYFLQACSSVDIMLKKGYGEKHKLPEDVLRKLQSA